MSQNRKSNKHSYLSVRTLLLGLFMAIVAVGIAEAIPRNHERSTRQLAPRSPITCSNDNFVKIPCDDLNDYIQLCGAVCPDATRDLGHGGCTQYTFSPLTPEFKEVTYAGTQNNICAFTKAKWDLRVTSMLSTWIHLDVPGPLVNEAQCRKEINIITSELEKHEMGHQRIFTNAVSLARTSWNGRRLARCGPNRDAALADLEEFKNQQIEETLDNLYAAMEREPRQPRILDCSKCAPAGNATL